MTKDKIVNIISQITQLEENFINENLSKSSLWDSFQNVEIILALESEFDITYSTEDMSNFTSAEKVIFITESYLNEA